MASNRHVLKALDNEWVVLGGRGRVSYRVVCWGERQAELAEYGDAAGLVASLRTGSLEDSSRLAWVLWGLAVADVFAVRVLLQAIVPGLGSELQWVLSWAERLHPELVADGDVDQVLVASALQAIGEAAGERRRWPLLSILRRTHRLVHREVRLADRWRQSTEMSHALVETAVPASGCRPPVA